MIPGNLPDGAKREMARRFFEGQAEPLLTVVAHRERALVQHVRELHEQLGIEEIETVPQPEDRVEQMQEFALAKLDGAGHEWYLEEMVGVENVDEAVEHAGRPLDEWGETKAGWAEFYRSEGMEGTDRELAEAHVRTHFGVSLDTFEEVIVEWDESDEKALVEDVLAGGINTAEQGIITATDHLGGD
jgi:hypothetical protein